MSELELQLLEHNQIFIVGDITEQLYYDFAVKLRYLVQIKQSKKIEVWINSDGGDIEAALSIVDEMNMAKNEGVIICTIATKAYSSAAIILAYGSKRFGTENMIAMIHPISYSLEEGDHQSAKSCVDFAERQYNEITTLLAMQCGRRKNHRAIKRFFSEIRNGLYMDVDKAIEFKLIDGRWPNDK